MPATTLAAKGTPPSAAGEKDTAAYVAPAYGAMEPRWKLCRDMMSGTEALREFSQEYIPQGADGTETDEEYAARVARTELFPMFKESIKGLVGLVFRTDPTLGTDVPAKIRDMWENIDGAGTAGAVFCKRVFTDAMVKGHAGILVDVPKVVTTKVLTKSQEAALGIRPYWVHVKAEQVINWRTQTINGNVVLTLLVISETVDVPSGAFLSIAETRYRVFRRNPQTGEILYEVWTQGTHDKDPELDDWGVLSGATRIPFAVVYAGERTAPLQSVPSMLDLAYTNVAHAQVLSDHRTSLHAAGNPILVIKGRIGGSAVDPNAPRPSQWATDAGGTPLASQAPPINTGPNQGIEIGLDGDVKYVEHAGQALSASSKELSDIETRGAAQGLSILQRNTRAAQTAETERLQRSEKDASLSGAARSLEDVIETCLAFTALFTGDVQGGSCTINRSFEDVGMDTARIDSLSKMVALNQITLRTMWQLLISGGALPQDFDMKKEEDALAQQAPVIDISTGGSTGAGGTGGTGTGSSAADDTGGGAPPLDKAA